MSRERSMWIALRPHLVKAGLDPVRIETPMSLGVPDVNITTGWVELKAIERWPVRGGVLSVPHYTPEQRAWATRRRRAGGGCWLLLRVADDWLLFDGAEAALCVGLARHDELVLRALVTVGSPSDPRLIEALKG